jgi:hypothetical protein
VFFLPSPAESQDILVACRVQCGTCVRFTARFPETNRASVQYRILWYTVLSARRSVLLRDFSNFSYVSALSSGVPRGVWEVQPPPPEIPKF